MIALDPADIAGQPVEALLDILARDRVERTVEPVAEMQPDGVAIMIDGALLPLGPDGEIFLEGFAQRRHEAGAGAAGGGILAGGPGDGRLAKLAARLRYAPPTTQLGRETVNALTFDLDQSTGAGQRLQVTLNGLAGFHMENPGLSPQIGRQSA